MALARTLSVLPLLVRYYVRSQMEYRVAFLLDRLSQIASYGSVYAAIWVLIHRFDNLGGWRWPELALLLSFQLLTYSFGAAFSFVQFRNVENLVRLGTFDVLLVRPMSPWAYLVFSGLNIGYAGHIVLAIGLMVWSLTQVSVDWNVWSALYFLGTIISASMVTCALITMIGASALFLVRSNYLFSIYFGFWELTRYPLNIFPAALTWIMVTIVPLGFTSYVPVAVLIGKPVAILGDWGGILSLLAGPLAAAIAMLHWRFAISKYQGAGG